MINITTTNITSITTTSEDPSFLVGMVLDNHPKRLYKAADGVNTAVISTTLVGRSNHLGIAGTNATNISVTAINPTSLSWFDDYWAPGTAWVAADIELEVSAIQRSASNSIWVDLGEDLPSTVILKIVCTAPVGETLQIGVLRVGLGETYLDSNGAVVNPDFGLGESRVDYSIDNELSNGSRYYFSRDRVRKFSAVVEMSHDSADSFMGSFDLNGEFPTAWRLTDIDSNRWVVFAKFDGPPTVIYGAFSTATVSFTLLEVL